MNISTNPHRRFRPLIVVFVLSLISAVSLKTLSLKQTSRSPQVLGETTTLNATQTASDLTFNIKVPAKFVNDVTFDQSLDVLGNLTANNILYSLRAGEGISVSGTQTPTIKNTGVLSVQGKTGALTLEAGGGIGLDGLKISNSDTGSGQNIFKNIAISGTTSFTSSANSDTLNFIPGTGITLTGNSTDKSITIGSYAAGWTRSGSNLYLTEISDNVGVGTTTPDVKFSIVGGAKISGGLNLLGSGITNAGAIVDATGLTSSGNITFSGLSQGIVKSSSLGLLSSSSLNISTGSSEISGTLSTLNGGTGLNSYLKGDLIFASANNILSSLGAGADGSSLVMSNGVPTWGNASGSASICTNCLVTNPGSTQTITASSSSTIGLSIKQPNSGNVDIFNVKDFTGNTTFLRIDSSGNLGLGQGSSTKIGSFVLSTLSDNRTYTFPNASGNVCLDTGNCAGLGSNIGGSGTLGYLTRWSGQYSLENSSLYDNGNVGIGTATPSAKLDVAGTGNFSGALNLASTLGVSGATTLSSTLGVSGAAILSSTLNVTSNITSGGVLKIDGLGGSYILGNLGIGTTNPSSTLDVAGTGNFSGAVTLGSTLNVTGAATFSSTISSTNNITSTGNLGIGTTSPSSKVDVVHNANSAALNVTADSITTATASALSIDGLTTGTGLLIQSTSANITTGKLLNLDETLTRTSSSGMSDNLLSLNRSITYNPSIPAITKENQTFGTTTAQNYTFSYTVGDYESRLLVVHTSNFSTGDCRTTGATFNGVAMTLVATAVGAYSYNHATLLYLVAPAKGTHNIVITNSCSSEFMYGASSWYNVNQTTPVGTYKTASGGAPSVTLTTTSTQVVVDSVAVYSGTLVMNASQTLIYKGGNYAASYKAGGASSTTMSWTGGSWGALVAVPLIPVDQASVGISGSMAAISSNCNGTGVCSDSASLLSLTQLNTSANGGILSISNAGIGAGIIVNDDGTSTDSTPFVIDANGNVGIGTATPSAKLNIVANYGGNSAVIINQLNTGALFSASSSGTTKITIAQNGLVNASVGGLATYIKAGTISDTDFTDTAVDGTLAVDSSDSRMYVRSGGVWKYIAFTGGFQIPDYEATNFSEGDLLLPYVEKKMADGAIHGLYMKLSDAPEIATLSASLTEKASLTDISMLQAITDNLKSLLTEIQNQINKLIARIDTLEKKSQEPQDQICLGSTESQTCVTKDQLDALIKIIPTPTASPSAEVSTTSGELTASVLATESSAINP